MAPEDPVIEASTPRQYGHLLPLLAATTISVYLLIVIGATTAVTDGAAVCSTWPTCDGRLFVLDGGASMIAWGHRVGALLTGGLILATVAVASVRSSSPRILGAIAVAAGLYSVQIVIGAFTAISGAEPVVSGVHLAVGMTIFAILVVALAWSLEEHFQDRTDESVSTIPETPVPEPSADPHVAPSIEATVRAYFGLMKPRLMWLLCLVAFAGMALAAGPALTPATVVATLFGGVLAIGASGTFNHVLERDIDRQMARTASRPVATDIVPVRNAIAFGVVLATSSVFVFLVFVNAFAAALGVTAIIFYSVVYTIILKPNTVQNTVIGGFAGALPAIIGWVAVTGSIGWPAVLLATVIFLWTPAHFYNLALAYRDDYERAGFPMMPVVKGERLTRRHIVLYLGATLVAAAVLTTVETLGWTFAVLLVLLAIVFLVAVMELHRNQSTQAAFLSFHASNVFLGGILLAIVIDALLI